MLRCSRRLLWIAVVSSACGRKDVPAPAASSSSNAVVTMTSASLIASARPAPRTRPKGDKEMPTTSPAIFIGNFDGEVGEGQRLLKGLAPTDPRTVPRLRSLAASYHAHGKFKGDLDEIQKGIEALDRCIALEPKSADVYLDRADQGQSLHRFKLARADVARAKELGAPSEKTDPVLQELDWNDGRYDAAIPAIRAAAKARKTDMFALAREAQLHHDLGEQEEADRGFDAAEDAFVDVNPLPVAWLDVQRGLHEIHTGKYDEAIEYYREAVRRIPTYVMANEHLAEALHLAGKDDEAVAIYEDVLTRSADPEFMGALAAIYREKGKTKEADVLKAKATASYEKLLSKYPEAMYWHASEFFMGEGKDPEKARELLTKNLELRPNSVSYVALARADLATNHAELAKADIDKALAMPIRSAELFWTAARVYAKADPKKSEDYAARARAFNPKIERVEPPIGR